MTLQKYVKVLLVAVLLTSSMAEARSRSGDDEGSGESRVTYDLSASTGTYDSYSYTEITLGLNWFMTDWFNWRNSVFSRQGSGLESFQGLDSAALFVTSTRSDKGTFGVEAFAGPGLRFATENSNALFAEAGLLFKISGLVLGIGAKALSYTSDSRTDPAGNTLPRTDTQTFIILGGSGVF